MESTAYGSNYQTNLLKIISKLKDSLLVSLSLIQSTSTCTAQNKGEKGEEKLHQKTRRQTGGFFAYVGRDVVNRAAKVASSIIKGATNEINSIAQQIIDQIISQGGKEIERVLTKVLRGAIEDAYQASFRPLGDFGKKQLKKLKNKILR